MDEVFNDFEQHMKRKSKNQKRIDFDEMLDQNTQNQAVNNDEFMFKKDKESMVSAEIQQKKMIKKNMTNLHSKETAITGGNIKSTVDSNLKKKTG